MRGNTALLTAVAVAAAAVTITSASAGVATTALSDRNEWQLNANSTLFSRQLALTPAAAHRFGTAFIKQKQHVSQGFDASFTYLASGGSPVGEGLAFVIQNRAATALGTGGRELGLGGIRSAVAIGIRTGSNPAIEIRQAGPSGLMANGPAIASVPVPNNILRTADGIANRVRITYVPGLMNVFLDGQVILRNVKVDLGKASAFDEDGKAWVGFAGANGPFGGDRQAITGFTFTSIPTPGAAAGLALAGLVVSRRRRSV